MFKIQNYKLLLFIPPGNLSPDGNHASVFGGP